MKALSIVIPLMSCHDNKVKPKTTPKSIANMEWEIVVLEGHILCPVSCMQMLLSKGMHMVVQDPIGFAAQILKMDRQTLVSKIDV